MRVGGYGKCPLQPFMTFWKLKLYQEFIWQHFGDVSLYSKLFVMATVFDSHGFTNLILVLVLFSKIYLLCRYAYTVWTFWHFVDLDQSWVILVVFWNHEKIKKPTNAKKKKKKKTLRIEDIRTIVWISERNYQVIWCHSLLLLSSKETLLAVLYTL